MRVTLIEENEEVWYAVCSHHVWSTLRLHLAHALSPIFAGI